MHENGLNFVIQSIFRNMENNFHVKGVQSPGSKNFVKWKTSLKLHRILLHFISISYNILKLLNNFNF